eukprot:230423-Rhodomonas_salina.2
MSSDEIKHPQNIPQIWKNALTTSSLEENKQLYKEWASAYDKDLTEHGCVAPSWSRHNPWQHPCRTANVQCTSRLMQLYGQSRLPLLSHPLLANSYNTLYPLRTAYFGCIGSEGCML